MDLPENIIQALENQKLKRKHPVYFQIFSLAPTFDGLGLDISLASDKKYDNVDDVHTAIAEMLEVEGGVIGRHFTLTYLPVVS